jgi:hypothetical protein
MRVRAAAEADNVCRGDFPRINAWAPTGSDPTAFAARSASHFSPCFSAICASAKVIAMPPKVFTSVECCA